MMNSLKIILKRLFQILFFGLMLGILISWFFMDASFHVKHTKSCRDDECRIDRLNAKIMDIN